MDPFIPSYTMMLIIGTPRKGHLVMGKPYSLSNPVKSTVSI